MERRWSQAWSVEYEKARNAAVEAGLKIKSIHDLKTTVDTQVRNKYLKSGDLTQVYLENITFTIPPETSVDLLLDGKRYGNMD